MKINRKFLMVMVTVLLFILAACDTSVETNGKTNNEESNSSSMQNANSDSSNKDSIDKNDNTTENASEDMNDTQLNDQEVTSDYATTNETSSKSNNATNTQVNSNDEGLLAPGSDSEVTKKNKEEYLKELSEMEEEDRYAEVATTTIGMKKQERERYEKWDSKLNEIYGVLEDQLRKQQMDTLREKQRNWVKHRDEVAKDASLKYKGGTMESLEYVATQANLTRERCYLLVAKYMK